MLGVVRFWRDFTAVTMCASWASDRVKSIVFLRSSSGVISAADPELLPLRDLVV
jgi:hypothetical protein